MEVKSNLLVGDTSQDSVGIGNSYITEKLHDIGGIGEKSIWVDGIGRVKVTTGKREKDENGNIREEDTSGRIKKKIWNE